jgi:hypothetical protein
MNIEKICDALKINNSFRELDLGNNSLGINCGNKMNLQMLPESLKINKTLMD